MGELGLGLPLQNRLATGADVLITRIQIEQGFLAGLDLSLPNGLTTIVGARGTGKTSLIEAIRFALAAKNYTPESKIESSEHAESILEGGEVVITLSDGFDDVLVSRNSGDIKPRSTHNYIPPIVFSQKEIEVVGTSASGRLSLIDGFVKGKSVAKSREAEIANSIKIIYRDIGLLDAEILRARESSEDIDQLKNKLQQLEMSEAEIKSTSVAAASKQDQITALSSELASIDVKIELLTKFSSQMRYFDEELSAFVEKGGDLRAAGLNLEHLQEFVDEYFRAISQIDLAAKQFSSLERKTLARLKVLNARKIEIEANSWSLRVEVEKLVEGAGAIARSVANFKSRLARSEEAARGIQERASRRKELMAKRDLLLDELEGIRVQRYRQRASVIASLNESLRPRVDISIERFGQYAEYTSAVADSLRGSGIKYNDLASKIAESLSPRELSKFVDEFDFQGLAAVAGIPKDRAARLVGALADSGLAEILTCNIEDNVRLRLLDGAEYKDVADLSAGQRCTVILPIVLQHHDRVLVIDQPEDHIDNAFIAETLIKSLLSRPPGAQIIVSTHNANIPVLGQANLVVHMVSDGRNGSINVAESLDDPRSVHAITTVMEGGLEAFESRASFYSAHSL